MTEHLLAIHQQLESPNEAQALFGNQDSHLKLMEEELNISIVTRGETVYVTGDEETFEIVDSLLASLLNLIRKGIEISERDVLYAIKMAKKQKLEFLKACMKRKLRKTPKENRSESKPSVKENISPP